MPPGKQTTHDILQELIESTIPAQFAHLKSPPKFAPHVTITSEIDPSIYEDDPEGWLENLDLSISALNPVVTFTQLDTEKPFFRKLTLRVEKDMALLALATECRAIAVEKGNERSAEQWCNTVFRPHCSLL